MRWMARSALGFRQRVRVLTILASAAVYGTILLYPVSVGAAVSDVAADRTLSKAPSVSGSSKAFGGVAFVGALFVMSDGQLSDHFCTASVVHSAHGDLAVTAAHCLIGIQGQIVFVPGYNNGKEPYGVWQVTAVYTDQAWQSGQDPDHDVAFLRLSRASGGTPIEDVTGAERLGIGWQEPALVQVVGYPDEADEAVSCTNWAKSFSSTQLEFDCDGYTDGTSGGPFLVGGTAASGHSTVIGVIGGYEQGGDTPDVSYAPTFGATVEALYQRAEAAG